MRALACFLATLLPITAWAQWDDVSSAQRARSAQLIVEGTVLDSGEVKLARVHKHPKDWTRPANNRLPVVGLLSCNRRPTLMDPRGRGPALETRQVILFLRIRKGRMVPLRLGGVEVERGATGLFWVVGEHLYGYVDAGLSSFEPDAGAYKLRRGPAGYLPASPKALRAQIARGLKGAREIAAALKTPAAEGGPKLVAMLLASTRPSYVLEHDGWELPEKIATAFGGAALPFVTDAIKRAESTDRLDPLLDVLYHLGPAARPAAPQLLRILAKGSPSPYTHSTLIAVIGRLGDPAAVPALRKLVRDASLARAAQAAGALVALGDRDAYPLIARRTPAELPKDLDRFPSVLQLLRALHKLDPKRARPLIERAAKSPVWKLESHKRYGDLPKLE